MQLTGLHLLLTYQCTFECDHCFVWGSPWQSGTMTLPVVRRILQQATTHASVKWIYFEGGEPGLYYPVLVEGVRLAAGMGFKVGLVTNAYWATHSEDAALWLRPLAGLIDDLSVSSDLYHYNVQLSRQAQTAMAAAHELNIPVGVISIAQPEGHTSANEGKVMYRGRASGKLASLAPKHTWDSFQTCPEEDLCEPGRVHIDPLGNLHICQGISLGNILDTPLEEICARYDPQTHPIIGPLVEGGPAALVKRFQLEHGGGYADACHLCYESRKQLRRHYPDILSPDQMYGSPS